ncbi:MAG TPA: hypothetical protein VHI73_01335 [Solirubrobacteraceae bacterium]|jgi:hypothetical protein|nr:hypothetical protein [Solirubrobacteraceae bacterium]
MIVDDARPTVADGRCELSARVRPPGMDVYLGARRRGTRAEPTDRRASRAVARSMRGLDAAQRPVEELRERLLIARADHR